MAASATAFQCAFGTVGASFCHAADHTVLVYAEHSLGNVSNAYAAASYYITGEGTNPYMQALNQARAALKETEEQFKELALYEPVIALNCHNLTFKPITDGFKTASASIDVGLDVLHRKNIYKYYEAAVHDDACGTALAGFGWLVVCQVIVGLVF